MTKIQLKRSNVLESGNAKEPTSEQMEYGELAVNYNDADPSLFIKDSNDNIVKIAGQGASGQPDVGDGTITIKQPGTLDQTFTVNQSGNTTITLKNDDTIVNPGNGTITIKQPGTLDQTFTVNQTGNSTITLKNDNTVVTPGDGALTIKTSGGDSATGTFTANQSGASTITLPAIKYSDLADVPPDAAAPGNGALTIETSGGDSATGTFTANQSGASTITLPAIDYNDLTSKPSIPAPAGAGTITITQPGTTDQTFNVNQSGNTTIALKNDNTVVTPGDGALTIKTSGGDSATGTFTANQSGASTITLPAIKYSDLADVPPAAAAPGDGALTIKTSGGDSATGSFTANQSGASTITLPAIDYNDLTSKPSIPAAAGAGTITVTQPGTTDQTFNVNQSGNTTIALKNDNTVVTPGDGALTIKTSAGDSATGTFTANQSGASTITLPAIDYNDLTSKPSIPAPAGAGTITITQPGIQNQTFNVNQSGNTTIALKNDNTVPSVGNGTITITQPGIQNQTFTVNQTGNTTIALKNDNTIVTPGNGALTIRNYGDTSSNSTGTFTANQSSGSVITLPQVKYTNISGTPSIPSVGNGTITIKQPGTTDQTFSVNQSGNKTITLKNDNTVVTPGDGAINFNAGNGLASSGSNATANQSGSTTKTFSVKAADDTINVSSSGIKVDTSKLPAGPGTNLGNSTTTTNVTVTSSTGSNTILPAATSTKAGVLDTTRYAKIYGALQTTGGTMTGSLYLGSTAPMIYSTGTSKAGITAGANQEVGLFAQHINQQQSFRIVYQGAELSHNGNGIPGINYGANRIGFTWNSPNLGIYVNTGFAGNLVPSGSDVRLKSNIETIPTALSVVNQLRPVAFTWLDTNFRYRASHIEAGGDSLIRYGFIADEVIDVLPQADQTPDPSDIDSDPMKDYNDRTIMAFLTKAIQELSAENDSLKQRVEALENL